MNSVFFNIPSSSELAATICSPLPNIVKGVPGHETQYHWNSGADFTLNFPKDARTSQAFGNDILGRAIAANLPEPRAGRESELASEFNTRAERWKRQTAVHSSLSVKFMHEDYQSIMAMGEPAIPLILRRLENSPDHWFWALKHLARKDVAQDTNNVKDATKAWLDWGRKKHYIK